MTKDQLLQKIEHLSLVKKLLIFFIIISLTIFFYWYFYYQPLYKQIDPLEKDIRNLEGTINKYKKTVAKLPKLKGKYQSLKDEFTYAETLLPETSQGVEKLLSSIEKLGNSLGIEFIHFAPGNEKHHDFYATRSVNLRIQGPFHNLMHFFSEMSRLNRLVSLERVQLHPKKSKNDLQIIEANTRISVYRALSNKERQ